ncbi:regulator of G-protein signaling 6 isoform X1 [Arapaima gigas]
MSHNSSTARCALFARAFPGIVRFPRLRFAALCKRQSDASNTRSAPLGPSPTISPQLNTAANHGAPSYLPAACQVCQKTAGMAQGSRDQGGVGTADPDDDSPNMIVYRKVGGALHHCLPMSWSLSDLL